MAMEETGSRIVGDYMVGAKKIGLGSFADVWMGRDLHDGSEVAVKEIDKRKLSDKVKDSLLKEITILRQVSHPNIVRLHQAIQGHYRQRRRYTSFWNIAPGEILLLIFIGMGGCLRTLQGIS